MKNEIMRGELYFAYLNPVRGSEQGGFRPVLIIQNDINNTFSPTTIVAALTSRTKAQLLTHVPVTAACLGKQSIILLEQIRTIDKSRLSDYIGQLSTSEMDMVDRAIALSCGLGCLEDLRHE